MTKTVVAVFEDFPTANAVVRRLVENGYAHKDISMIALDEKGQFKEQIQNIQPKNQEERTGLVNGAGAGAGIGAILGGVAGLLIGMGVFIIPGFGPVLAAGPLAAAVGGLAGGAAGAVAGGMVGGMVGMLTDAGVSEEQANFYVENIRRGGILVAVQTDDDLAAAAKLIMDEFHPIDANQTVQEPAEQTSDPLVDETDSVQFAGDSQPANLNTTTSVSNTSVAKSTAHNEEDTGYSVENLSEIPASFIASEYDQGFEAFDRDYRTHYASALGESGKPYEFYLPGYQYGYALAADERFRHLAWDELEPEAQHIWLSKHREATWDEVKDAVRYSWEDVRSEME